ncbi:MAG: CoA-binding protein [Spirochaetaceae bacterium]|nr:CoA-binding protein [Spirochaetaceae bacterium]
MAATNHQVAVLGASRNRQRYANRAVRALQQHGYDVIPINPAHDAIEGLPVVPDLAALQRQVHTLTVYVGPRHIAPLIDDIVAARPRRVILNPGTESEALEHALDEHAIPYLEACTLVLLATGQFETALAPAPAPLDAAAAGSGP